MQRTRLVVVLVLALGTAGLAGCGEDGDEAEQGAARAGQRLPARLDPRIAAALPPGVTLQMAQRGQRLFEAACAACHGPQGGGTQIGPALNDAEWLHIQGALDEIVQLIRAGVPNPQQFTIPMPPREGEFSDAELRDLAAYVAALKALGPPAPPPGTHAAADSAVAAGAGAPPAATPVR